SQQKGSLKLLWPIDQADTTSPTACDRFEHQWKFKLSDRLASLFKRMQDSRSGQHGQTSFGHCLASRYLVSHNRHCARRWPDKSNLHIRTHLGEAHIFREKTIPRMNGLSLRKNCRTEDIGHI